jgi:hypothetical protein
MMKGRQKEMVRMKPFGDYGMHSFEFGALEAVLSRSRYRTTGLTRTLPGRKITRLKPCNSKFSSVFVMK